MLGEVIKHAVEMPINGALVAHTEFVQYCFMSSLMAMSFLCSFGPVWYQPTILSLAGKKQKQTADKHLQVGL